MLSAVVYSPVCDADSITYNRYLALCEKYLAFYRDVGDVCGDAGAYSRLLSAIGSVVSGRERAGLSVCQDGCGAGSSIGASGAGGFANGEASSGAKCDPVRTDPVCSFAGVRDGSGVSSGCDGTTAVGDDKLERGDGDADSGGHSAPSVGSVGLDPVAVVGCAAKGKHYERNRSRREREKKRKAGGAASVASVCTVDTRTAVEIEAAQTLAERRVAENRLAVAQANARAASYADKDKSKALERLQAARLSQRINQANTAASKAYSARDKSLTSVDSTGSAGEYALRQEIKAARNSQFLNEYLRKQNDVLARYADSAALAAADRIPKPRFDDAYDVMKDEYDRADPERVAQLDADVAVENARWNDVLNSGEGFVDEPVVIKKPEAGETLEELYAKVRAETEQLDAAQREIDEKKKKLADDDRFDIAQREIDAANA